MIQEEKAALETKLRELADMVERQENGRQLLLAEVLFSFYVFSFWKLAIGYSWEIAVLRISQMVVFRECVDTYSVAC